MSASSKVEWPNAKSGMRFSLAQQVEEVQRELALRDGFYRAQVAAGRTRNPLAEYHIARLKAALGTLQWLAEHETHVCAYVAARLRTALADSGNAG